MQVYCLFLLIIICVLPQTLYVTATSCGKRLDLVFAVDTTSSLTSADFDAVKEQVKDIASNFTIDPLFTRMALVSVAAMASVISDFDAVKSLSDFKLAVSSRISFNNGAADLSEGIKVVTDNLVVKARKGDVPFVLVLVKDRRSVGFLAHDSNMLTKITKAAKDIRSQGATINTVGIGGVWNTKELEAVYGTEYLLLKDKTKALESIKSLGKAAVCINNCPQRNKILKEQGMCFGSLRRVITDKMTLVSTTPTLMSCRSEIVGDFEMCSDDDGKRCSDFVGDRKVGDCRSDNKLTVTVTLQNIQSKTQKCRKTEIKSDIACGDVDACPDQKADIIIVVDRSRSINDQNFPLVLESTADLVRNLSIGPNNVKLGVVSFGEYVYTEIDLGSDDSRASNVDKILYMNKSLEYGTRTHLGLERAIDQFKSSGRQGVRKFAFLITDGESDIPSETFEKTQLMKNMDITLYCIGVKNPRISELKAMTAPETNERMVILQKFSDMKEWSLGFSKKMCQMTAPPNAILCDDNVYVQSVSACEKEKQYVTSISFLFKANKKCVKSTQTQTMTSCNSKCTSPTDANEYLDGSTWNSMCYEFKCEGTTPKVVSSKCVAADGTCKDIGSPPFKCLDLESKEFDNCVCESHGSGQAKLVIDRH